MKHKFKTVFSHGTKITELTVCCPPSDGVWPVTVSELCNIKVRKYDIDTHSSAKNVFNSFLEESHKCCVITDYSPNPYMPLPMPENLSSYMREVESCMRVVSNKRFNDRGRTYDAPGEIPWIPPAYPYREPEIGASHTAIVIQTMLESSPARVAHVTTWSSAHSCIAAYRIVQFASTADLTMFLMMV